MNTTPIYLKTIEVEEVASFLGISFEECKERIIKYNPQELAENWRKVNPRTEKEIRNFYAMNSLYLFELTKGNASKERADFQGKVLGCLFEFYPPDLFRRVLDFGAGVGSDLLKFLERGYEASFSDLPGITAEFIKYRLKMRNFTAKFIPIEDKLPNLMDEYDIIICFDVLEHVWDPIKTLNFLVDHLSTKGVIAIINCPDDEDGDHPCHLPHTFPILGQFWLPYLDYVGLTGIREGKHIYKKASFFKRLIKKIRYYIWRKTGLYFRLPEGFSK